MGGGRMVVFCLIRGSICYIRILSVSLETSRIWCHLPQGVRTSAKSFAVPPSSPHKARTSNIGICWASKTKAFCKCLKRGHWGHWWLWRERQHTVQSCWLLASFPDENGSSTGLSQGTAPSARRLLPPSSPQAAEAWCISVAWSCEQGNMWKVPLPAGWHLNSDSRIISAVFSFFFFLFYLRILLDSQYPLPASILPQSPGFSALLSQGGCSDTLHLSTTAPITNCPNAVQQSQLSHQTQVLYFSGFQYSSSSTQNWGQGIEISLQLASSTSYEVMLSAKAFPLVRTLTESSMLIFMQPVRVCHFLSSNFLSNPPAPTWMHTHIGYKCLHVHFPPKKSKPSTFAVWPWPGLQWAASRWEGMENNQSQGHAGGGQ